MTVSKRKARQLQRLRGEGYTLREISNRTSVPVPTVHRYVRNVPMNGHHPGESAPRPKTRDHGFSTDPGRHIDMPIGRRYGGLFVHLPDTVTCPACSKVSDDVVFCLDCGRCWIADCGHGSELEEDGHRGFSLGELKRGKGNGELHVFPLMFRKG